VVHTAASMANNLSPPALKSKKSSDHLLEKETYDPLFLQDNILNDGYTYSDHSSDEDAPTQRPALSGLQPPQPSDGHRLPSTTALDDPVPIFTKRFGDSRRPRIADAELGLALPANAPQQDAVPQSAAIVTGGAPADRPKMFEIMHNWTQELQDDELISYINVAERNASEVNEISRVRGHVGWLSVQSDCHSYD
jgi:hypothetical protein